MKDLTKFLIEARKVEAKALNAKFIDSPEEVAFTHFAHEHFPMVLDLLDKQRMALDFFRRQIRVLQAMAGHPSAQDACRNIIAQGSYCLEMVELMMEIVKYTPDLTDAEVDKLDRGV